MSDRQRRANDAIKAYQHAVRDRLKFTVGGALGSRWLAMMNLARVVYDVLSMRVESGGGVKHEDTKLVEGRRQR